MFYRSDGWILTPLGAAVQGADVAILDQPAAFDTQPGSPLAEIFAADTSNSANITAAVWAAQQIQFTFDAVPDDVVENSYFAVAGASPAGFNSTLEAPWQVVSIVGNVVTVAALDNPGTYVSGGTVATSVLPNPTSTDGNGHYFFYADAGIYSIQEYYSTVELDFVDQGVGTVAGGSVLSVGLTAPAQFAVTGSPVTTTGTLAITWNTQSANVVLAGPVSGGAASPTFRSLVAADIPSLDYVTSVAVSIAVPGILTESVAGSPITGSGTAAITIGLATQSENTVWAGPTSGSAAQPTFRSLVAADIPGAVLSVATLTLTATQIKNLHGTPIQIVAAPGAGKMLLPVSATLQYKFGTVAYANVTSANIAIAASGVLGSTNEPIQFTAEGLIDQTASEIAIGASDSEAMAQSAVSGAALVVANEGGSGEFTTGDGTITITLWYMVLTLS
jgi:hypothetical protein